MKVDRFDPLRTRGQLPLNEGSRVREDSKVLTRCQRPLAALPTLISSRSGYRRGDCGPRGRIRRWLGSQTESIHVLPLSFSSDAKEIKRASGRTRDINSTVGSTGPRYRKRVERSNGVSQRDVFLAISFRPQDDFWRTFLFRKSQNKAV